MDKYYNLLGLHLDAVKEHFDNNKINYTVTTIQGRKDQDKLIIPRVINISDCNNGVELVVTYFSDSLN